LKIAPKTAKQFTVMLRIPAWSTKTEVFLNGQSMASHKPGAYLTLKCDCQAGDEVTLRLDMGQRYEAGDLEQAGNVTMYRGPILLCADDRFKVAGPITIDVAKLHEARMMPINDTIAKSAGPYRPWRVLDLPVAEGTTLRLIDFAGAGATGQEYQSWLPATGIRPPKPAAWLPLNGAKVAPGAITFTWRNPVAGDLTNRRHSVVIADSETFERPILSFGD
jgi:hypothetical protein